MCFLVICVFIVEMSIKIFCPFFDWVVHFFNTELQDLFVYFGG